MKKHLLLRIYIHLTIPTVKLQGKTAFVGHHQLQRFLPSWRCMSVTDAMAQCISETMPTLHDSYRGRLIVFALPFHSLHNGAYSSLKVIVTRQGVSHVFGFRSGNRFYRFYRSYSIHRNNRPYSFYRFYGAFFIRQAFDHLISSHASHICHHGRWHEEALYLVNIDIYRHKWRISQFGQLPEHHLLLRFIR